MPRLTIGNRIIVNRIPVSAMECWDAHASGNPTETAFRRYERLARGNADVHTVEALSVVDENGRQLHELTPLPQNRKRLTDVVAA